MLLSQSSEDVHTIVKTMHDVLAKDEHQILAPNVQFRFDNKDYRQLELATLICGSLSIFSAIVVVAMYIHLSIYYPKDANRVSLHCVIFAMILSFIDDCLNVASLSYGVYSSFCSAFREVDGIITLISCCLLALVGVHLLLVFYFHVRQWPCRPEYIFFPVAILYGIVGNIRSFVSNDIPPNFTTIYVQKPHVCWYYSNFIDRIYNYSAWIYYYSFIFFIIVISFFSSLIAMWKVYHDKMENQARLLKIVTRGSASPDPSIPPNERGRSPVQNTLIRTMKENRDSFSTIVIRSLLYPLTPCLSSIWGFGLQMYLVDKTHFATFPISMINVVMSRLEGFFIACIFCMDPSVQKAQRKLWSRIWSCFFRRPKTNPPAALATCTTHLTPTPVVASKKLQSSVPTATTTSDTLPPTIPFLEPSGSDNSVLTVETDTRV